MGLAVVMGFVAARVTGETDVTPTKALGPVTQLLYGVITPGNLSGNIMSANVTGGIGLHAADLLTTLKTGWLLGASPRASLALLKLSQALAAFDGEEFVSPEHVQAIAVEAIAHRIVLERERSFAGASAAAVVEEIVKALPVPV